MCRPMHSTTGSNGSQAPLTGWGRRVIIARGRDHDGAPLRDFVVRTTDYLNQHKEAS